MIADLLHVALYALVPAAAALLGGLLAAFHPPGPQARALIQHFAAGVVFASVAGEILPSLERQSVAAPVLGFAIGVPLVLAIRQLGHGLARRVSDDGASGGPLPLAITAAADLLADGFPVGVGFLAGDATGRILTIALALEIFFVGLSVAAALAGAGSARWPVIAVPAGLALLFAGGAVLGAALLRGTGAFVRAVVLAVGVVIFLYLAAEELLTEAHKAPETTWSTVTFFAGFLALLVVEMLAG